MRKGIRGLHMKLLLIFQGRSLEQLDPQQKPDCSSLKSGLVRGTRLGIWTYQRVPEEELATCPHPTQTHLKNRGKGQIVIQGISCSYPSFLVLLWRKCMTPNICSWMTLSSLSSLGGILKAGFRKGWCTIYLGRYGYPPHCYISKEFL